MSVSTETKCPERKFREDSILTYIYVINEMSDYEWRAPISLQSFDRSPNDIRRAVGYCSESG